MFLVLAKCVVKFHGHLKRTSARPIQGVIRYRLNRFAHDAEVGGSECESNAPATSKMPPTGFEDRDDHRTACASATIVVKKPEAVVMGVDTGAQRRMKIGNWQLAIDLWRRGSESNRRIEVLQTSALPLGYRADRNWLPQCQCKWNRSRIAMKSLTGPNGLDCGCGVHMPRETRLD